VARREAPGVCSPSTTITLHRSSSTTTRHLHSAWMISTRRPTRGAARAMCRPAGAAELGASVEQPVRRGVDNFILSRQGRGIRLLLAVVDARGSDGKLPWKVLPCRSAYCSCRYRRRGAAIGWEAPSAAPSAPTCRPQVAIVATAACRIRCTASAAASTTRNGTINFSICRDRSSGIDQSDSCRVRRARRLRGRRGHHVADHARRNDERIRRCTARTISRP